MNIYPILVFAHVLGAVGMFAALGIEAVAHSRFRRAETVGGALAWMGVMRVPARLGPTSMLLVLASGIWMMARWWGPRPWIVAALAGLIVIGILGGAVTGRRMKRLGKALASENGPFLSAAFRSHQNSIVLSASLWLRITFGTGILALMTIKPGFAGSFLVAAATVVAGVTVVAALAAGRSTEASAKAADHLRITEVER